MKTVLFLVLLFVGSNALRANNRLRGDGTAEMAPADEPSNDRPFPSEPRPSGPRPSGPPMDDPRPADMPDEEDPISAIINEEMRRGSEVHKECEAQLAECIKMAGTDEGKRGECFEKMQNEIESRIKKIHDECVAKMDEIIKRKQEENKQGPGSQDENSGEDLEMVAQRIIFQMVEEKFEDIVEKRIGQFLKKFVTANVSKENFIARIKEISDRVEEEEEEKFEQLRQKGREYIRGEVEKFRENLKENIETLMKEKMEGKGDKKMNEEKMEKLREGIRKKLRMSLLKKMKLATNSFMRNKTGEFGVIVSAFVDRVKELVKEEFPENKKEQKKE